MLSQNPDLIKMDVGKVEDSLRRLKELYASSVEAKECLLLAPEAVFVWDVGWIIHRGVRFVVLGAVGFPILPFGL